MLSLKFYFLIEVLWLLFIIATISSGIRRLNDLKKSWLFLFIPFYNLYLLAQKKEDYRNADGFVPLKNNAHLNLKSFGIAFVLSVIIVTHTLKYFSSHGGGGFMGIGVVILVAGVGLLLLLCCFVVIRMIANFIVKEKIYPNLIFQILLPFLFILDVSFIIYGVYFFKPFGVMEDFMQALKFFIIEILPYIAVFAIVPGFIFSKDLPKKEIEKRVLLRDNLMVLILLLILSFSSTLLFYRSNKIIQPKMDESYSNYKSLEESITSENYIIKPLFLTPSGQHVSKPYFLENKKELIINVLYSRIDDDDNEPYPFYTSYKINREGIIISKLDASELESVRVFPIVFDKGYLVDYGPTVISSWVFNGNRERLNYKELNKKKDWKIEELVADTTKVKLVAFLKKEKFHCNAFDSIEYNGTKFYNILKENGILKIRIDSIYSHIDNIENCEEKTIVYYKCEGMNFNLLCFNDREYYIIKPRKKT